jgi:CRP-like cAMP-binding protein
MTTASDKKRLQNELALALPYLSPQQIAQVSPKLRRLGFQAGEIIIQQGDKADRFYIVVKGRVEVWYKSTKNHDYKVAFCEVGDYFGETGLMQNAPRNSTIRVTEEGDAEVLALDRDDFLVMLEQSKATEQEIAAEMARRLLNLSRYSS